ncbi:MAG: hypothetical protein OEV40_03575 [Acidimicrobiia bacterium]|nr:hypothetical protein [Acidimicrobiia bacterium]
MASRSVAAGPRRNRVDPWGDLHAVVERGLFTGNRGCLVDDGGRVVRHQGASLWIICHTEFRGWRHPLAAPRTWTPLFFLDDAVALAAGHRPCGLCRRDEYRAYRDAVTAWSGCPEPLLAPELNRRLAGERLRRGRGLDRAGDRILGRAELDVVPVGTVVIPQSDRQPHLVTALHLQPFGFDGWGRPVDRPSGAMVDVLTPPTSVAALRRGFHPQLHPTAAGER